MENWGNWGGWTPGENCCNKLQHVWPCFYCCCCCFFFGIFARFTSFCIWISVFELHNLGCLKYYKFTFCWFAGVHSRQSESCIPKASDLPICNHIESIGFQFDTFRFSSIDSSTNSSRKDAQFSFGEHFCSCCCSKDKSSQTEIDKFTCKILEFLIDTSGFVRFKEAHALV